MSELINNAEQLDKALDALYDREKFYEDARKQAAIATYDHKIKRAVAFKSTTGTVKEREMLADEIASTEMRARFIAEAASDIAKEKLLDVRTAISARQSILNAETRSRFSFRCPPSPV